MRRLTHLASLVLFVALVSCNNDDNSGPTGPTGVDAVLSVSNFTVLGSTTTTGVRYSIHLRVQETTGRTALTITGLVFTLHNAQGAFGVTAFTPTAMETPAVTGGGTVDSREVIITDDRAATPFASRVTLVVSFIDANGRVGTASGSADVPPLT